MALQKLEYDQKLSSQELFLGVLVVAWACSIVRAKYLVENVGSNEQIDVSWDIKVLVG
jgi:hypothetical protein